jgi:hypothetical protein
MSAGGLVISFLWALFYCVIIILVAVGFVWGFRLVFEKEIDGQVYKWGRIAVGLLCFIILVSWLIGALSGVPIIRPLSF